VAHPHFTGEEPALKIKPLMMVLDRYNAILALGGEAEAAKVEETYFTFQEKKNGPWMCYEWDGILTSTNEKFLMQVCDKALPRMQARAAALESAHREVDALKGPAAAMEV
jgi:hypothetical protein